MNTWPIISPTVVQAFKMVIGNYGNGKTHLMY